MNFRGSPMKKIIHDEEFVKRNFEKTLSLIKDTVKSDRKEKILSLFDTFQVRYATAPASQQKTYHSAFLGGLCFHNLNVLQWVGRFASLMAKDEFTNETLLVVSLLHDIGLIGNRDKEYFIPQTSDWHLKQGLMYEINKDIDFVKTAHRSLFLLQEFDIKLSKDEFVAILLQDGQTDHSNQHYSNKEPKLAQILQFAKSTATKAERDNYEY